MDQSILYIAGAITALIAAAFSIRKLWGWLFPIRVKPGISIRFDESEPDEILATVTNRSWEPVYVVKCRGRSANSIGYIIATHLRKPLIKPRLYKAVRFGAPVFEMIGSEPVRIEPHQQIKLSHKLSFDFPISGFTNPMLQIEVILSNERAFYSKRLRIPKRWHVLHRSERTSEDATHA